MYLAIVLPVVAVATVENTCLLQEHVTALASVGAGGNIQLSMDQDSSVATRNEAQNGDNANKTVQAFCEQSFKGTCKDANNKGALTYGKCGVTWDDCKQICADNAECAGFHVWQSGSCHPACYISVPGFDQTTLPNVDADKEPAQGGAPRRRNTRRREWGFSQGSGATTITKGSGPTTHKVECTIQTPPPSTLTLPLSATVTSGCGSSSTSSLRMNKCRSTKWSLKVGCMIGQGGSITITYKSDEAKSRDTKETMKVLVDGAVVGTLFNDDCNPVTCTATVPWSASATSLTVEAASGSSVGGTHMSINSMVFDAGVEQWCVGECGSTPVITASAACTATSSGTGKLRVHTLCLEENLAGPVIGNLPMRSPTMYTVAETNRGSGTLAIAKQDIIYFSWTSDKKFGNQSSDGRVYITKMKISTTPGTAPTKKGSVFWDGFVRTGGIDVTEGGVVGTLCAKYVPSWMTLCKPAATQTYCPLALAVCQAETTGGTFVKKLTPWRIGKQYNPATSTGRAGAYQLGSIDAYRAGSTGYLTYSGSGTTGRWSTWYSASWGTHSGYAMHTYANDAAAEALPDLTSKLLLNITEIRNLKEDFEPTDHHRIGTGDHQAGSGAWNYHTALGDIGLIKHTHGGVYMQHYGIPTTATTGLMQMNNAGTPNDPVESSCSNRRRVGTTYPNSPFQPTQAHGSAATETATACSRLYLKKTLASGLVDHAKEEGGLRQCGDTHWILALNSNLSGNICAKVKVDGTITKWKTIGGAAPGGARGKAMTRIAPLGKSHDTACDGTSRFLYGYENPDASRWLVELDGNCVQKTTPIDVSDVTTWPVGQDWTTTSSGAVVWVTAWRKNQKASLDEYYKKKACTFPTEDADGYMCQTTPSTVLPQTEASNEAKLTIYYPTTTR